MEINDSITKKSYHDHLVWCSFENHDHSSQSSSNFKTYTCSFCKKGFSNAQALGGHMNIHRKDRARLRQAFADEVLLSLEITSSASDSIDRDHHHGPQNSDDKSILIAEPNDDQRRNEKDAVHPNKCSQKMQKQPVYADANLESSEPSGDEKIQWRIHDLPRNETLDLELRLGPEIRDTTERSGKEFF